MTDIQYTHHARSKFGILKRHDFEVTSDQVEETVRNPEKVIPQPGSKFIAHFSKDGQLVLLEILDTSEFLSSLIKATLRSNKSDKQELLSAVA